jgi:hypothetical protein
VAVHLDQPVGDVGEDPQRFRPRHLAVGDDGS